MNWTGGSLQRTKNANKGTLQKQKAYFARARTQLQNDTAGPAVPFLPNYLCGNDDTGFTRQFSLSGSGPVRHTGHAVERRIEAQGASLSKSNWADCDAAHSQASDHHVAQKHAAQSFAGRRRREGRSDADEDIEIQLLEANRKRLLRQKDWIGLAPSMPVTLQFLTKSQKDRIGKRRRTKGQHGALARTHTKNDILGNQTQAAGGTVPPGFVTGATQDGVKNVHIRIGTDALTSTYLSQRSDHIQSHSSSDCMLFDEEGEDAQPDVEIQLRRPTPALRLRDSASLTDVRTQRGHPQHPKPCLPGRLSDQADPDYYQMQSSDAEVIPATGNPTKSTAPGYQITHQAQGIERPLRLVFENSHSCASDFSPILSQQVIDESPNAQTAEHAGASQRGCMHQDDSNNEGSIIEGRSATLAIVNENRWRRLLAISDGHSSHPKSLIEAGNRAMPRLYPAAQYGEAVANWSQHATQGDRTHISSSSISASLSVFGRPELAVTSERRDNQAGTASRGMDEDERLWQGYVFGSEDNFVSESSRNHEGNGAHKTSEGLGNSSSRFLPLSAAVSSVSSTPFRLISGRASCISDNVQNRATFAPPSGTRTISPALFAFADGLSDGEGGSTKVEDRIFGGESVSHASLQNNACLDTSDISPGFIDGTRTSRSGLDRPDCTRNLFSAWAEDGTQELGRALFAHEKLATWSEGLDLVDPNALR